MSLLLQNLLCLGVGLTALAWLTRHYGLWGPRKAAKACGGACPKCSASGPELPLIDSLGPEAQLQLIKVRRFKLH